MTRTRHETDAGLSAFAEGTLDAGERDRIGAHLAACPRCRRTVAEYRALGESLRGHASATDAAYESAAWTAPGPLERALAGSQAAGTIRPTASRPLPHKEMSTMKTLDRSVPRRFPAAPSWRWTAGLAAAFLLGGLSGAWFSQGKLSAGKDVEAQTVADLADLNRGLIIYAQDWDEYMPPMRDSSQMREMLKDFLRDIRSPKKPQVEPPPPPPPDLSVFRDPATHLPYQPNPALFRVNRKRIARPGQTVTFYAARPSPDGTRAVAFLDGTVRRVPEAQWARVLRLSDAQTRLAGRKGKPLPRVRGTGRSGK